MSAHLLTLQNGMVFVRKALAEPLFESRNRFDVRIPEISITRSMASKESSARLRTSFDFCPNKAF